MATAADCAGEWTSRTPPFALEGLVAVASVAESEFAGGRTSECSNSLSPCAGQNSVRRSHWPAAIHLRRDLSRPSTPRGLRGCVLTSAIRVDALTKNEAGPLFEEARPVVTHRFEER
jgi:hypothetical protein